MVESHLSKLAKWHKTEISERETSQQGFYFPRLKTCMDKLLGSTPKRYASRYFQLKSGQGAIGTFLVKIKVTKTPKCWWCGEAEQSVEHLYTKCRKWRRQRRKLLRRLSAKQINWQGWTEKKGLAKLIADGEALGPLVKFLKIIEVGNKTGAREKEREGERENNYAGKNRLND